LLSLFFFLLVTLVFIFIKSKLTSQCLLYRIALLYYFLSLSSNMSKIVFKLTIIHLLFTIVHFTMAS